MYRESLELAQVSQGLDDFNPCLSGSLRDELQQRVPLLLLSLHPPATVTSRHAEPELPDKAAAPTTARSVSKERRFSRAGIVNDIAKLNAADAVPLGDRIFLAWLNHMSREADRVFPHSGCGEDASRLPPFQQLTSLSELSNCQQLVRVVFTLLVMRTAEFAQRSKVQVPPPVVPLAQSEVRVVNACRPRLFILLETSCEWPTRRCQAFLSAVESQRSSPYAVAQRILVTVHELSRLPAKLRTAQTILASSPERLRVFCNVLMAAFPPMTPRSVDFDEPAAEALEHIQACDSAVQATSSVVQQCKAVEVLAQFETGNGGSATYPSDQVVELLTKFHTEEAGRLHRSITDLVKTANRLQHAQAHVETLRDHGRMGCALALEGRKEVNRHCIEDLALLIV